MKNIMIEYDAESVRWMKYHTALKEFFESVAGLPNVPANEDETHGKNVKVIYATPSSAFTKYVMPLVNGLTQRPIITFYLSEEETLNEVSGTFALINRYYYEDEDGYKRVSFSRPLMKSLTYSCNIFTTKMSDCDYLLTLLEINCNKFKPYSCKVNGRPAQFYLDGVESGTPTDYEGKKFISSSFKVTVPLASIFPAEIETDVDVIKRINAYLSDDIQVIPDNEYSEVEPPVKAELSLYYEKTDLGDYKKTKDVEIDKSKTYYIKNEKYVELDKHIDEFINMFSKIEQPQIEDLPYYYEYSNKFEMFVPTKDTDIIENKNYYIKNN